MFLSQFDDRACRRPSECWTAVGTRQLPIATTADIKLQLWSQQLLVARHEAAEPRKAIAQGFSHATDMLGSVDEDLVREVRQMTQGGFLCALLRFWHFCLVQLGAP